MRFGICNELFEHWDLGATCLAVRELGYEGIELAPFTLARRIDELSERELRAHRETIESAGLETIGLHWLLANTEGLHLTHPDAAVRHETADYLVALAKATAALGGSVMVFGSPKQRSLIEGVTNAQALEYAVEVFRRAMPAIAGLGIDLCLEPLAPTETDFINSIAEAKLIINRVENARFRLHLDVKAMSADPGGGIPELIVRHGREAGHVHVQDPGNLRGPGMGETDFGPILQALRQAQYDRWVSVEVFDYSAGPEETARRSIGCLRQ